MIHRDRGCILKTYPLGEQGLIVCWLTQEKGVLRTAARAARRPGSSFFGQLDLFFECELQCSAPKSGDLYTLKTVDMLRPRLALRSDLQRLRSASYMAQLMLRTVEHAHAEPHWHELMSGALDYLQDHDASRAIIRHFEKRLAALHGIYSPGRSAPRALAEHFGGLPAGREELMELLP